MKTGSVTLMSLLTTLLLSAGCTSQQAFEGIKAKNRNDCYNLPDSQQEECLKAADVSFEEYQRRLKEIEESK
jgi:hypothetical protein